MQPMWPKAMVSPDKSSLQLPGYISGIDGLRAMAVLAVMLYHLAEHVLPGGFTGVDVFFVISGYVVSGSLARDADKPLGSFVLGFYARRIRRIFPALVVVLLVSGFLATLFIPKSWLSSSSQLTALYAFFGLSNFALIKFNDGYFSPRVDFNPYTHTWSLAVEEQFYLIFPLIFFLWLVFRAREGYLSALLRNVLVVAGIASLVFAWYQTEMAPDKAFYLLPSRFWELAAGALLFTAHASGRLKPSSGTTKSLALLTGLVLVLAGFVLASKSAFPFPWALLPVLGTVLLIIGLVTMQHLSPVQAVLESRWARYIGKRSYSLYLWHWPVYVLLRWTTGLEAIVFQLIAVILTFVLAHFTYRWVELPFLRGQRVKNIPSKWLLPTGLLLLVVAFWIERQVFFHQHQISQSVVVREADQWFPYTWPGELTKNPEGRWSGHRLFVMGDSHAGAYKAMLAKLSAETGLDVVLLSKGGCGVANLLSPVLQDGNPCKTSVNQQLDQIRQEAKPGDAVFLASLRSYRFGDQWAQISPEKLKLIRTHPGWVKLRAKALQEAMDFIGTLQEMGLKVIVDSPKPVFKAPNLRCSDWFNRNNPICRPGLKISRQELFEHQQFPRSALQKLQQRYPKLLVWDPLPVLCPGQECQANDAAGPLFMDGDHLSAHGNVRLYPDFVHFLESSGLYTDHKAADENSQSSAATRG